jgi:hypothetical protein
MHKENGQPYFNDNNLLNEAVQTKLLQNICALLNDQKNLYAIRSLYRIISLSKNKVA